MITLEEAPNVPVVLISKPATLPESEFTKFEFLTLVTSSPPTSWVE